MIKRFINKLTMNQQIEVAEQNKFWFTGGGRIKQTSYDQDDAFHNNYDFAQKNTQMESTDNPLRRMRHYSLMKLLRNARINKGFIAECGCWRGLSTFQIAAFLRDQEYEHTFHVFDSFEGLSEINEIDKPWDRQIDESVLRKQFACGLDIVKNNLSEFSFIKFHKGWIPARFCDVDDLVFSFVNVDVDLAEPIRECLEFFFPRLINNGIIYLDDYGCTQFPGAKITVDNFVKENPDVFFLPMPPGDAFILKNV
jgi:hypothetical protein